MKKLARLVGLATLGLSSCTIEPHVELFNTLTSPVAVEVKLFGETKSLQIKPGESERFLGAEIGEVTIKLSENSWCYHTRRDIPQDFVGTVG